ncbi:Rieske (2Fe-2S) protein [Frankia sp. Cas3]|uniref:Rieske (2Fe-2S) protein n=1 Tax=Frankia sp. Cas3 TaxID=3073926 RepID=UPI002AD20731|nr:Rieske (2Fe-2S) protein [Frankia sp. Cas3]
MTALRWQRLKDHDRQLIQSRPVSGEQRTDYPIGWYFARFSEDLAPGQVVPVEFMSRRYALFRDQDGAVVMIDGQYSAADRDPPRARQPTIPVLERVGNIWFWYGPEPAREFLDVASFDSSRYTNVKGEIHIGRSDPLPMFEHVADSYHFPHNHKAAGQLEYIVTANEGDRFEFQLRPAPGTDGVNVQRFFKPHAFIEMAGPCIAVYRAQKNATINRDSPLLTVLLGATPVRENVSILSWRIAVRKVGTTPFHSPLNWLLTRAIWRVIAWNVHVDLEVLKWMRRPAKTLWVKPDGSSVREYRNFYNRAIIAGWRPDHQPDPQPAPDRPEVELTGNRD